MASGPAITCSQRALCVCAPADDPRPSIDRILGALVHGQHIEHGQHTRVLPRI